MTILVLDAALDGCLAALVQDGNIIAERRQAGSRGNSGALPAMTQSILHQAGIDATHLSLIAVTIGPGSFTGIRAALSLAHGIALAASVPIIGATVGHAIRATLAKTRPVWVAIDSRRSRVFLDDGETVRSVALDALPTPRGPVTVAGDGAIQVASRWAATGIDTLLSDARRPTAPGIAAAAQANPQHPQPLYIDAVEARPSLTGRPAPV